MELKKEKSCGCIIIKNNKVLLIYEKVSQYWGFPKGHMEETETELETAKREVKEEVGLDVDIVKDKRYELNYITDKGINKTTVLYVAMPKNEKIVMQESEIERTKWCDFEMALNILTYDNSKDLLKNVIKDMQNEKCSKAILQDDKEN